MRFAMLLALHNPFWPGLMVFVVLVAAFAVARLEGPNQGLMWPRRALTLYAAPALVVVLMGYLQNSSPFAWEVENCADPACRTAVKDHYVFTQDLKYFATLALAVFLIMLIAGLRYFTRQERKNNDLSIDLRAKSQRLDPRKWSFDPDTGEHYPIDFRHEDGNLIIKEPYHERKTKYLVAAQEARAVGAFAWVFWIASALIEFEWPVSSLWGIIDNIGLIFCVPMAVACSYMYLFKRAMLIGQRAKVGPQPIPPPGREQVDQEMAHGPGGRLTGDRLKTAARGGKQHPGGESEGQPLQTFKD